MNRSFRPAARAKSVRVHVYAVHDRALECCKSTLIVVTARCLADTMKGKGNEHCTREAKDVVGDVVCRFEGALELSFAAAEH